MVHKAAPFLYADHDPYPVVVDGRILWIIDLYTVSSDYPYSQEAISGFTSTLSRRESAWQLPDSFNYIRNSVKATVDAYDGTLTFYVIDETDPPDQRLPTDLPGGVRRGRADIRGAAQPLPLPREDLFRVQSRAWLRYHVPDVPTFYIGEDTWQIPADPTTNTEVAEVLRGDRPLGVAGWSGSTSCSPITCSPRYRGRLGLVCHPTAVHPTGRQNLTALLVARSDPEGYGELIDFRFPQGQLVDGPTQVSARIEQDDEISAAFTLWSQQGQA